MKIKEEAEEKIVAQSFQSTTLEEKFAIIENMLAQMEEETATLDKVFELYESGIKLVRDCNDSIDKVEKDMIILNENGE